MRVVPAVLLLLILILSAEVHAAEDSIVFYRIGESGQEAWAVLKQRLEEGGLAFVIVQGETVIEKHVEKVNRINRGPWKVFCGLELIPGQKSRVMVAESDAGKSEGRFVPIDRIPARFAGESDRLAADVAAQFNVKVKHLPLFPLLGVTMPGIVVKLEFKEGETEDVMAKLLSGVEKYFSEGIKR
ncbi:MAG: hypothetical protein ABSC19_06160 [Syntrophorhabdales bacterium]|jgi:hypothetical protein